MKKVIVVTTARDLEEIVFEPDEATSFSVEDNSGTLRLWLRKRDQPAATPVAVFSQYGWVSVIVETREDA